MRPASSHAATSSDFAFAKPRSKALRPRIDASMRPEPNAVITGASSVIGGAIATAIASTGAAVCLVGRNAERLEAIAGKICATARSVLIIKSDLTEESAVEDLTHRLGQGFKPLDVLVHCAGAFTTGKIETTPVNQLDALYRANVRLPFVLTQALLPLLKLGPGQIVFINSSQGLSARATTGPYAATQHALKALADSLRQEVNADGVRVLSVYPGRTATARMSLFMRLKAENISPSCCFRLKISRKSSSLRFNYPGPQR